MMKVTNEISIYEVGGEETRAVGGPRLEVRSHWNRRDFVVLQHGDMSITVVAAQLEAAIDNATNVRR